MIRKLYTLKCVAVYGHATICFYNEATRDERAAQLMHAGHAVAISMQRH